MTSHDSIATSDRSLLRELTALWATPFQPTEEVLERAHITYDEEVFEGLRAGACDALRSLTAAARGFAVALLTRDTAVHQLVWERVNDVCNSRSEHETLMRVLETRTAVAERATTPTSAMVLSSDITKWPLEWPASDADDADDVQRYNELRARLRSLQKQSEELAVMQRYVDKQSDAVSHALSLRDTALPERGSDLLTELDHCDKRGKRLADAISKKAKLTERLRKAAQEQDDEAADAQSNDQQQLSAAARAVF
eukprot:TRINITY_DN5555_c0_g1_i1.p1 TRINITY_DN5555_c0_g1~~TRINITY_DN5555_c0_g1_i1.p1  ORF type:complete len:254 (-),score=43.52 TRINITY_DN5555_c0_g1_i1:43-804(-)